VEDVPVAELLLLADAWVVTSPDVADGAAGVAAVTADA
jgi:hypothetical protein